MTLIDDNPTVAQYAVRRLADLGIKHAFGVPGDFAFPIDDAIADEPRLQWVVTTNELNASYAADGYARVNGCALLTTTYGVGELSAINGIMGCKAEHLVVFHLVGAPPARLMRSRRHMHHTLGQGDKHEFVPLSAAAACVHAILHPSNAIEEMERVIRVALDKKQPAYILIPHDYGTMHVLGSPVTGVPLDQVPPPTSQESQLKLAAKSVIRRLKDAQRPVVFTSYKLQRYGLLDKAQEFIEKYNLPFTFTPMDKSIYSEQHPLFIGLYRGCSSAQEVQDIVHGADVVLDLGETLFDDLSTGFGTARFSRDGVITLATDHVSYIEGAANVQMDHWTCEPVWLGDILDILLESDLPRFDIPIPPPVPFPELRHGDEGLTYMDIGNHLSSFLQPGDFYVCETGTCSVQFSRLPVPGGCTYLNNTLWASIGWATGATLGVALAAPERRVVMVTGDYSHMMVVAEVSTMGRYGINPIIVIVNNDVMAIEEFLLDNQMLEYNQLPKWEYTALPKAFGCTEWLSIKVETVQELKQALETARQTEGAVYIQAVLEEKVLSPLCSAAIRQEYLIPASPSMKRETL